ncbi:MAG: type III restriction endonuclease subunit R, partial [Gammaproteobacteria bacterium]|nr:type III restriction endonuclease subunit R [Gammaproteobacteria bacterium]
MSPAGPEDRAREEIDRLLTAAGWYVCDFGAHDISKPCAIREFPLKKGHGAVDYLLYLQGKAVGVVEAKKVGYTLKGVEVQSAKYTAGLPDDLPAWGRPLPFAFESTGKETQFTNNLDPQPRSRRIFAFYKPAGLAALLNMATEAETRVADAEGTYIPEGRTFLARMQTMPPLIEEGLWGKQAEAV